MDIYIPNSNPYSQIIAQATIYAIIHLYL